MGSDFFVRKSSQREHILIRPCYDSQSDLSELEGIWFDCHTLKWNAAVVIIKLNSKEYWSGLNERNERMSKKKDW